MSYSLQLTEVKVKRHQVTAMHLMCGFVFIASGMVTYLYSTQLMYYGLAVTALGLFILVMAVIRNRVLTRPGVNRAFRIAELAIVALVSGYCLSQRLLFPAGIFAVLGLALLFALFWEKEGNAALSVHIDNNGITLPSSGRSKLIPWTETESVMLRFGTLSIDCTDNRRFQWNIQEIAIKTAELEQFCADRIEEHRSKRLTNNW